MARRWAATALAVWLAVLVATAAVPALEMKTMGEEGAMAEEEDVRDRQGTIVGRPNLSVEIPDNRVEAGETATLSAYLVNDASVFRGGDPRDEERVTTAFDVSIRPRTEEFSGRLAGELEFLTERVSVGTVPAGVTGPVQFRIAVGDSLPPGRYRVPFAVTYSYVGFVRPNESVVVRTRTETLAATLVVEGRPRLRLSALPNQSLSPGESEAVRFAVENVGSETASEVGVRLSADNGSIYFGTRLDRQSAAGFYVPALAPGESETLAVRMGADDAALAGTYLVSGSATFRDGSGEVRDESWLAAGIPVERNGAPAARPNYSPSAPSRTITAIPVSKSAIASAESSARPTPRSAPSSWTIATSSPGRISGPTAETNLAKTFLPSRTNGSLSSPTTTRPAGASRASATR